MKCPDAKLLADALVAADKENERLRKAIETLRQYAYDTHNYWDNDQDMKVGKRLASMAGMLPDYCVRIDHALILRGEQVPKETK